MTSGVTTPLWLLSLNYTRSYRISRLEMLLSSCSLLNLHGVGPLLFLQLVNEKPQLIQEYESGKAIPNPQILSKLSRVLGVTLRKNPTK